jgi:hypothetical protein
MGACCRHRSTASLPSLKCTAQLHKAACHARKPWNTGLLCWAQRRLHNCGSAQRHMHASDVANRRPGVCNIVVLAATCARCSISQAPHLCMSWLQGPELGIMRTSRLLAQERSGSVDLDARRPPQRSVTTSLLPCRLPRWAGSELLRCHAPCRPQAGAPSGFATHTCSSSPSNALAHASLPAEHATQQQATWLPLDGSLRQPRPALARLHPDLHHPYQVPPPLDLQYPCRSHTGMHQAC